MTATRLIALLAGLIALAGPARADDEEDAAVDDVAARAEFDAALELLGRDEREAARRLEALAEARPRSGWADDALSQAAQLSEEKLGDPERARRLYAKLAAEYPSSRLSLRARARVAFLTENLRGGAAPLAEYQAILLGYAGRPPAESARRMEALVARWPDFPLAGEAMLWLAGQAAREQRWEEAARRYREVEQRMPGTEAAAQARKGIADVLLAARRPFAARPVYRAIAADGTMPQAIRDAARAGERHATEGILRFVLDLVSIAFVALFITISAIVARPWRAWPMPIELAYYLPVAALFVFGASRQSPPIFLAAGLTAIGGAAVLWAAGALAEARPRWSVASRVALGIVALVACAAVFYVALYTADVLDFVAETLQHGPDR